MSRVWKVEKPHYCAKEFSLIPPDGIDIDVKIDYDDVNHSKVRKAARNIVKALNAQVKSKRQQVIDFIKSCGTAGASFGQIQRFIVELNGYNYDEMQQVNKWDTASPPVFKRRFRGYWCVNLGSTRRRGILQETCVFRDGRWVHKEVDAQSAVIKALCYLVDMEPGQVWTENHWRLALQLVQDLGIPFEKLNSQTTFKKKLDKVSYLPKAHNGCQCMCHKQPGVMHIMACC